MASVVLMLKKILSTILHHNPFLHQRLNFSLDLLNILPDLQGGFCHFKHCFWYEEPTENLS